jgi:predicted PurR-regulated permease PerM
VVLVLIIYFIISNIIYNFISPKVFGDAVHLSPMLIILAFVVGGYLAGILGLFLAVPLAASVRIVFLYLQERVYA